MIDTEETPKPVRSKAYLIDPETLKVIWMNGSAQRDHKGMAHKEPLDIEKAVPMTKILGISDVLPIVSDTGEPRHLHTATISTRKGAMGLTASLYRLPDGKLLLLIENAWQMKSRTGERRPSTRDFS